MSQTNGQGHDWVNASEKQAPNKPKLKKVKLVEVSHTHNYGKLPEVNVEPVNPKSGKGWLWATVIILLVLLLIVAAYSAGKDKGSPAAPVVVKEEKPAPVVVKEEKPAPVVVKVKVEGDTHTHHHYHTTPPVVIEKETIVVRPVVKERTIVVKGIDHCEEERIRHEATVAAWKAYFASTSK
jgi:hypothetical protein